MDRTEMIHDNRQISIRLELHGNRVMAGLGLTAVQANLLLYILEQADAGTSLTEIHQEFGYSMAALCGQVKRLREKGYVRVESCAGDNRRKRLFSTEKGLQVRHILDRSFHMAQDCLYDQFTQEELVTLDRLQKKMLRNLSALQETNQWEVSEL